jgi:serine/threonine-protein kinase HipA
MIDVYLKNQNIASFIQDNNNYILEYKNFNIKNSISLSLANTKRYYHYKYRFPPYFEMFLPEGYLYEIFKNFLTKEYGYIDDYLIFSKLAPNIDARVGFKSKFEKNEFDKLDIDYILKHDNVDTFNNLLNLFLNKNAISGVQPKTIALLNDKETLKIKEYIIKTWKDEFANLAENEYFCLKAVQKTGVDIPKIYLSENKKFLVVENFIYEENQVLGFEEVLSLMDKNRDLKYSGSYEQIAKIIYQFSTQKKEDLNKFYKIILMNYFLKNGDAHLKNFGLLFNNDFSKIRLSPAYDIVNTTVYIHKDKPALTMFGKKVWYSKELIEFGVKYCLLTKKESTDIYNICVDVLHQTIEEMQKYINQNPNFKQVGKKMIDSFKLFDRTIKEVDDELIRTWRNY